MTDTTTMPTNVADDAWIDFRTNPPTITAADDHVPEWLDLDELVPVAVRDAMDAAITELAELLPAVQRAAYKAWQARSAFEAAVNDARDELGRLSGRPDVSDGVFAIASHLTQHGRLMAYAGSVADYGHAIEDREWTYEVPQ
jgi:hypothetical protein